MILPTCFDDLEESFSRNLEVQFKKVCLSAKTIAFLLEISLKSLAVVW